MKKFVFAVFSLIAVCLLSSMCSGAMGWGSTFSGIQAVSRGSLPGAFILESPSSSQYLFAWPQKGGYAITFLTRQGAVVPPAEAGWAECVGCVNLAYTIKAYCEAGWRDITPDKLPPQILQNLAGSTAVTILARAASSVPLVVVIPSGVNVAPQPEVIVQ